MYVWQFVNFTKFTASHSYVYVSMYVRIALLIQRAAFLLFVLC